MMEIRVKFLGGPLDGQTAMTNRLSDVKVFFPEAGRILLYVRENETSYAFDLKRSKGLEANYQEAHAKLAPKPSIFGENDETLRFVRTK